MLQRKASLAPASFDAETRTITVSWGVGAPVQRRDAQGPYIERLSMKPEHVDLSGLKRGPVFIDHIPSARALIGAIERAWIENGEGFAKIKLSSRADVAGHVQDIADGILNSTSVGYGVTRWADSVDGKGNRTRTATAWAAREISFVGLSADPAAKVRGQQWTPNLKMSRKLRQPQLSRRRALRFDKSSGKLAARPNKLTN